MIIQLTDTGKRFNQDWIFKHLSIQFTKQKSYVITGPNGSGKSTLLQCIAGSSNLSEGSIQYSINNSLVNDAAIYQEISIVAPYVELIEEMTAKEFLQFHFSFKPLLKNTSVQQILAEINLEKAANKQIRYFSSGMKQRIKLAQAIFAQTAILLLDEPCTNLDTTGYHLYHQLINNYCREKIVIVSSNDVNEYDFCEEKISIMDFKN